ncbi:MAG: hypothetical protein WA941_11885 [Nitrososphaeraceae archaeon]
MQPTFDTTLRHESLAWIGSLTQKLISTSRRVTVSIGPFYQPEYDNASEILARLYFYGGAIRY